jgi:hypothetical protein
MSTRMALATVAALVTALSFQATASARPAAHASNQAVHRLQGSDAFGAVGAQSGPSISRSSNGAFFGSQRLGRDPDPNVRLELLRDKDLGKT